MQKARVRTILYQTGAARDANETQENRDSRKNLDLENYISRPSRIPLICIGPVAQ